MNIILFLCNWGPHAAFQSLQDQRKLIPTEIKMIRIPCIGRISKALLFKPFEMGADGVALVGCEPGTCRYGKGTETGQSNVEDTRGILDLLGLGRDRLRLGTFMPEDDDGLYRFLLEFADEIKKCGPSPVTPEFKELPHLDQDQMIEQLIAKHDIYACQECGKCSSACPLTLAGKPFSPRAIANAIINGEIESDTVTKDVWACLTCGLCYERCPSAVDFSAFIRDLRYILKSEGCSSCEVHGGFLQSLMRTMTAPDLDIRHWKWLPDDLQIDQQSKILFFGGCAPYFDRFFKRHLGINTGDILIDSLRLLNFFDIHPALLPDERCCGHDLLWSGDRENYLKLAQLNVDRIHQMGIEEVITACPECYRSLARDYGEQGIRMNFKVTHLYEFLEKEIDKGAVGFKPLDRRFTFQDPCRLSRLENRAYLPRKLIRRMESAEFIEMKDREASAICCGNCAWIGCDSFSKALQVKHLQQARETGSDLLITACPKCQIHLKCAMEDRLRESDPDLEMMDLASLLARTIEWT